ncbi:MAG: fused DSP-PTPase phosphatase/NAD kinase-like protein [Pyrinomonadaceae bacterium]
MIKNLLSGNVFALALILGFSIMVSAQTSPSASDFPAVKIGNFGQMDERFYRGAQPLPTDFQALKDLGIKTVIDLRNDPTDYEKSAVEALGMTYVNIPMSGWKTPKDADLEKFMSLVNNAGTGKFFVHCKAGIHRTGVTGAVYRMENYGWDYDKSYKEMKNYNFSWWMVHGKLKTYVKDYAEKMEDRAKLPAVTTAASMAGH